MPPHARPPERAAWIALLILTVIWSLNWTVMKAAMAYAGPFTFSAMRYVIGTVVLFLLLALRRESLQPPPLAPTLLIGLTQTTGFQALAQWALVAGGAGKTALFAYTMPFWVVPLAWWWLHEKPGARQWTGTVLADRHRDRQAPVQARRDQAAVADRVADAVRHTGTARAAAADPRTSGGVGCALHRRAAVQRAAVVRRVLGAVPAERVVSAEARGRLDQPRGADRGRAVCMGPAGGTAFRRRMGRHRADRDRPAEPELRGVSRQACMSRFAARAPMIAGRTPEVLPAA